MNFSVREIPEIYLVGQSLPVAEVYGPQSRKANAYCKSRVEVAFYRQFLKKENELKQISLSKSLKMFPQYNEAILKKWLKEQSELYKTGRDEGWWKLLSSAPNLTEEELRNLMTPEMVCCYETMLASKQKLLDAGFYTNLEDQLQDEELLESGEASNVDDEIKLAPWHVTHNFLLATQGKALLELYGNGDPTGCGQGFSFIRIPVKSTFHKRWMDHTQKDLVQTGKYSLAQQQQIYKEEIMRIWDAQYASLSCRQIMPLSREDSEKYKNEDDPQDNNTNFDARSVISYSSRPPSVLPQHLHDDDLEDNISLSSMTSRSAVVTGPNLKKVLIIKRTIRLPDGDYISESECVRDPLVISGYLHQRKNMQSVFSKNEDSIVSSSSITKQFFKKFKFESADSAHHPYSIDEASKKVTCSQCGQVGHMKTNRACPMYSAFFESTSALTSTTSTTTATSEVVLDIDSTQHGNSPRPFLITKFPKDPYLRKMRQERETSMEDFSRELKGVCMALFKVPNVSQIYQ